MIAYQRRVDGGTNFQAYLTLEISDPLNNIRSLNLVSNDNDNISVYQLEALFSPNRINYRS